MEFVLSLHIYICNVCVLTGESPVQLSGLTAGRHTLEITPLGCSGGSRTLSVQFTT